MKRTIFGEVVRGVDIDSQTRCAHWNSELDIIAVKFKCCGEWFPCFECHSVEADHEPLVWPLDERGAEAVLCGACGHKLMVNEYLASNSTCPACKGNFNPGCARHYHLYFS